MAMTAKTIPARSEVRKFLSGLGKTQKHIVALLQERRVKGVCDDAHKCALAQALTNEFGASSRYQWNVDTDFIQLLTGKYTEWGWEPDDESLDAPLISVPTNQALGKFICDFDNGKYPELEKKTRVKA